MERAVDFLATHPVAGLPLQPGGRKTSITLAAFRRLLDAGKARSMLVIAPLRVARQTWPAEVAKWEQFRDMRVEVLHGPDKDAALKREAEIYLLNPEGVPWLSNKFFGRQLPFDVLCIDELTRFKNSQSQRSKLLRPHTQKTPYKWGLTGSLRPNTHMDLFGQQLMLDHGAALGRFITHFREKYFVKGFNGFSYDLRQGAEAEIAERLAGTWFYMDPKDYSQLPPLVEDIRRITLSSEARKVYDRMQSALVADLAGQQITAVNAGALYSKLAQMANGAVYSEGKASVIHLHDDKLDALDELLEELDGAPLLVAYEFNHDLARIQERFGKRMPGGVVPWLGKGTSKAQETEWIEAWNRNELPMLCAHPASAGHGLNLQEGNAQHVCYFSVTWDWELYDQFLRRVRRSGNEAQQIWNHILLVEGTIDEDKLEAQREKDAGQARLLQTLNKLILRDFAPNMETTMPNDKLPTAATWGAKPKGWGAAAPVEAEEAAPAPTRAAPKGWGAAAPVEAEEAAPAPTRAAPKGWGAATPAAPDTTAQREKIAERISAPVEDAEVVEETAPLPEEVKSRFAALADQIKAASINPTGIEEPAEPVKAAPTRGRPRKTAEPVTQAPKAPEPVAEAVAGDVQDSGWQAPKAAAPSSFSRIDAMRMALSAVEDGKVSAAEVVKLAREIHAFVSEE